MEKSNRPNKEKKKPKSGMKRHGLKGIVFMKNE